MREQRTLCYRCANDYRDAGYIIRRDYSVTIKDACDICSCAYGLACYISRDAAKDKTLNRKRG